MLIKMHERGVTFGRKIVDLIQGEVVSLSEKDDFSDVAYIVKEDGSLIYYEGESVDEVHHFGFENWLSILK